VSTVRYRCRPAPRPCHRAAAGRRDHYLYPKDRFPTAAVYGPAPGAQLRLITCGGTFDPALRSYLSNVVVYAVAAGPWTRQGKL
jgi:hypothetical protein